MPSNASIYCMIPNMTKWIAINKKLHMQICQQGNLSRSGKIRSNPTKQLDECVFFKKNMVLCEHKQEEKIMLTIQEMMNNLTTSCPEGTKIMTSNKNSACFLHENQLMNKMVFDKSINEELCARSMFFVFFYYSPCILAYPLHWGISQPFLN